MTDEAGELSFSRWPSIVSFSNVCTSFRKLFTTFDQLLDHKCLCRFFLCRAPPDLELPRLYNLVKDKSPEGFEYRGKVKLHGTNAAVRINESSFNVQSRNQFNPQHGSTCIGAFQKWWMTLWDPDADAKSGFCDKPYEKLSIFGELAGPGIQKGVALNLLPNQIFAIFAVEMDSSFLVEPERIKAWLARKGPIPEPIHVLPWHEPSSFTIDFKQIDAPHMVEQVEKMSAIVEEIDKLDPWCKETFNVDGTGEGIVVYPTSIMCGKGFLSRELFSELVFKAKGESHKIVSKKTKGISTSPEVAESAKEFAKMFVTVPRCEQGVQEACEGVPSRKNTGKFMSWIVADVKKESGDEIEASGLSWKQVEGFVKQEARTWYLANSII